METFLKKHFSWLGCLWEKIWPQRESQFVPSVVTVSSATQVSSYIPTSETITVLYDFESRGPEELSVKQGEQLCKISDEGDYVMARKIQDSMEAGLVPLNYISQSTFVINPPTIQEPWYVDVTNRYEAERLLLSPPNTDGSYLVRPSDSKTGQYSLSVRSRDQITHFRIQMNDKGEYYLQTGRCFSTIQDLIVFHRTNWRLLNSQLLQPCVQQVICDSWERPRSEFTLIKKLGEGFFGEVWEGTWVGRERVAIKTFKQDDMNTNDFELEINALKNLHHPNLIQLFAVCSIGEPIYIVTELMTNGNLQHYLIDEGNRLRSADFLHIISQVANGMAYLETEHIVHRDLAARNVLVGDNLICKIADFGLARLLKDDLYSPKSNRNIPIKWTAPEALKFYKYSIKSDVWSYGILLYEVYTLGQQPYKGMTNREAVENISSGYRLPRPPICSKDVYNVMSSCWLDEPQHRPSFQELVKKISIIQQSTR
ncbi:tyrosine-protein kinase Srms [Bombina bombina]|uniref:tyrosine-protein kinase Srms n=1 Tax=Bombina bombina TaxID=8345 RepID=UPI00235AF400|nr:tyrosine-protein kinase Srms [Bombina bombina]